MKHFFTDLVPCRTIQLSDVFDIYCLVDDRDVEWAQQWRWNFLWNRFNDRPLYARRNVGEARQTLYLHRELMLAISDLPLSYTDRHVVDHVNGNTLDNRRANLRWVTPRENRRNIHLAGTVPSLEDIASLCPAFEFGELPF